MRDQQKSYSMPIAIGIVLGAMFILFLLFKFGVL